MTVKEVVADSTKLRIDSGYFANGMIAAERIVDRFPNFRLDDITSTLRKGIFDIKADSYVDSEEGVPFVRIGDLQNGMIRKGSTALIPKRAHAAEAKTALTRGDLVLSKTAYPAAAMVNLDECNVSQDTIAIRLNGLGKARFRAGFITAFLNSGQGYALMARRFQGNVQQHLALEDARAIRIPCLDRALQTGVHQLMEDADLKQDDSAAKLGEAEGALLATLGLADWTPPEALSYTACASELVTAGRMDAQYFMPAKERVLRSLAAMPGRKLGECVGSIREMFGPDGVPSGTRVRNYDVKDALVPLLDEEKTPSFAGEIGSVKKYLKDGDVVISRLRAYLKEIAVVRVGGDIPSVGSSEFIVLRLRRGVCDISAETLMVFLRSPPVQTVLKWCQDGSQHPRFSERDLLSIPVPDAVARRNDEITTIVREGCFAGRDAGRLVDRATHAVEIAMGYGEAAAFAFLESSGSVV